MAQTATAGAAQGAAPAALPIVFADAYLLVVNKPAGLLVHRTRLDAHEDDSALDRLRQQLGEAAAIGLAPAHRLDKGTSGLLVFTRHADAARKLGAAWAAGAVAKRYVCLVRGWPEDEFVVDHPLARDPEQPSAGQPHSPARTRFASVARVQWPFQVDARHPHSRYALLWAWPEEGRRHQIRRHLKHAAHPLVGDATHGKGPHNRAVAAWLGHARLWLHATDLWLPHPADGQPLHLHAQPGPEWQALGASGHWQPGFEAVSPALALPAAATLAPR